MEIRVLPPPPKDSHLPPPLHPPVFTKFADAFFARAWRDGHERIVQKHVTLQDVYGPQVTYGDVHGEVRAPLALTFSALH